MRRIRRAFLYWTIGALLLISLGLTGLLLQSRYQTRAWGPARSARVRLQARDADQVVGALEVLARQMGGSMTDSRLRRFPTGGKRGSATLCVPVAHFDEAVDGVRGLAKVVSLSLGTDELTGEIADREAQISNENREEVAVAMVLSRVDRLDEVVGLQRNLARIRGRVARHSGELRAMRSQSELAAVEVRLHEPTGALALVSSGASSASYVNNAAGLLRTMGEVLLAVLIYLIMVGGVVLVPALVAWWFLVARRRRDGSLAGPEEKRGDGAGRPAAGLGHDERDRRKALGLESPPAK